MNPDNLKRNKLTSISSDTHLASAETQELEQLEQHKEQLQQENQGCQAPHQLRNVTQPVEPASPNPRANDCMQAAVPQTQGLPPLAPAATEAAVQTTCDGPAATAASPCRLQPLGTGSTALDTNAASRPSASSTLSALQVPLSPSLPGSGALLGLQPSGETSPTAASEQSVATTFASTSSAIPFSRIAFQRKQQEREALVLQAAQTMLNDAAAAFDLRMEGYCLDISALQQMNDAAAQEYSATAEIAAALGQFVSDLSARQAAARDALAVLPQLDRQFEVLSTAVSQLDKRSKQLESKLGLKPAGGSSSAYSYLASSVSQLTAAGMSGAAAGLGCLGAGVHVVSSKEK